MEKKKKGFTLLELIIAIAIVGILIGVLLPAIQQVRATPHGTVCRNQCQQLALALLDYENANLHFPPAYIADENGKPMHSWRVLILPYLDQQALYDSYSMDEPWDGPNNSKLHDQFVHAFRCPSNRDEKCVSDYVMITGEGTGFVADKKLRYSDLADGFSYTIMLTEVSEAAADFHWMEPRDITLDEFVDSASKESSACRKGGRNVALFDGSTHVLDVKTPPEELRRLVLIDDGGDVSIHK